ncbi:DUF5107 domain-containing protein [Anaerocolumna sp. MB42-C2]|uniref:DUF5107 domain-containing protein n=1 Tax=Anaerocolumna sp. MB42-C2 TaxID=3070997 RepID=UPI0027DEF4CD|nr:DUF5107 domain-containing protein [Anaerocolumna sp. MB42-C2]WMJ89737.1 DUF5107 domain-containing protein [Anaerocolumna sp. MB42-C2]
MNEEFNSVKVWEEVVTIPTYEIGEPGKNPIFSEKRVYQGSSGKVYPYPVIEKISDKKVDKEYHAIYLENQYIKVMILPELGGRIQRAYDKTNDYDFVYYNHVIKPALVGLTGPWISGGIEFNWPQHHRPTTFLPVDYKLQENEDGSRTVLVNDVDQMYGTKGIAAFTLYPDKAYIEIRGQLYNRTPFPQTFLWWANPAVAVNDYTQSIFPPDVHAVMDHGKRDVSKFPIATGVYYKKDYSEGVDISRYKNIPVPTSYMAERSDFDFVGGYDYRKKAGILHVADHHISPGKKQWTWGSGEFGKAWDRNLTDEDGPYIELMTGVYTDNQPDFSWLKPFEEKTFKQYFMPYKSVGEVKNATIHAMVNMVCEENSVYLCVYATEKYESAKIVLKNKGELISQDVKTISPVSIYEKTIPLSFSLEHELTVEVYDKMDRLLVDYTPVKKKSEKLPDPAEPAKDPAEIFTNEELYLTGLHIEQYRHATYEPDDYYLEGLRRDKGDIRINNAYGSLLFRRGLLKEAEEHFRTAIKRLTWKNPNPYNSEAYYFLGLSLFCQEHMEEAFDAFYKASWTNEQQEMSFYYLAAIAVRKEKYKEALEFIEKALIKNSHNIKARGLKAVILRKLGHKEVNDFIEESLKIDGFDYVSAYEKILNQKAVNVISETENNQQGTKSEKPLAYNESGEELTENLVSLMRNFSENFIQTARDYAEFGLYQEAIDVLKLCSEENPMLKYYEAYYSNKLSDTNEAEEALKAAQKRTNLFCFPNKLEDIPVLFYAIENNKKDAKAPYLLGNLYYDKKQFKTAKELWEISAERDNSNGAVFRNLSHVYYNKEKDPVKARKALEKAFALNTTDDRIMLELDQLYKKFNLSAAERLSLYETHPDTFKQRDDMYIEYITLLNQIGEHAKALDNILAHKFHPWEGGEGKVTAQYKTSLLELAKGELKAGDYDKAMKYLKAALVYPENLGEGKLEGTKDNHLNYYIGCTYEAMGKTEFAKEYYNLAAEGNEEPAGMMYYNDQPADMILYQGLALKKLGKTAASNARFYKLIDYGEQHRFDKIRIDYFAVSLPDFMIFEEDWDKRNEAHCYYLIGLGNLGLGDIEKAKEAFAKTLELDKNHLNCILYNKI